MKNRKYDVMLLLILFVLLIFGLMILYSSSSYNGEVKFCDGCYYLKKQLFSTCIGLFVMLGVANVDYHLWRNLAYLGYFISILLGIAVLFVGEEYNGSKRWLSLGPFSFQPSEYAKIAVILFLAQVVTVKVNEIVKVTTMVKIMGMILPSVALVGTNNLSTAIIILGIGVVVVFVASPKYSQFLAIGLAGIGVMALFLGMESYRMERLAIWRNPEKYEKGYQTLQGL